MKNLSIEKMITVDKYGMPKAPSITQLLRKDIRELYIRDRTESKENYIKECGVIYYLGDPKSPPKQRGLSYSGCLKEAIKNFDLPNNYQPDVLVMRLINEYYKENITEAGIAVEVLQKSIHNVTVGAGKLNEILNEKLSGAITLEEVQSVITIMDNLKKQVADIPVLTKRLQEAYDNLQYETETQKGRGDVVITSSVDADEDDD